MHTHTKHEAHDIGVAVAADTRLEGKAKPFDTVGAIMAYEEGELDEEGTIELFQHLLDTGVVWQLQGHYGRAAQSMINHGIITPHRADRAA